MLPTKPSQTTTSTWSLNKSWPSTLPMKFKSSFLQSLKASSVSSLPLESSVPMLKNADARIFASQHFARIDAAHHGKLREVQRLAFDVRAGVEQHKLIFLPRNDRGDAAAIHAGNAAELESGRRENAAGVAEGNHRVGLAVADQFGGAGDGRILLFARARLTGLSSIVHDLAGVDDADAMIAKAVAPAARRGSPPGCRPGKGWRFSCCLPAPARTPAMTTPQPWSPPMTSTAIRIDERTRNSPRSGAEIRRPP